MHINIFIFLEHAFFWRNLTPSVKFLQKKHEHFNPLKSKICSFFIMKLAISKAIRGKNDHFFWCFQRFFLKRFLVKIPDWSIQFFHIYNLYVPHVKMKKWKPSLELWCFLSFIEMRECLINLIFYYILFLFKIDFCLLIIIITDDGL